MPAIDKVKQREASWVEVVKVMMKAISTETRLELNKLGRDESWFGSSRSNIEVQVAALEAIGHSAEAKAIPEFVHLLVIEKGEVWRAAAEATAKLMAALESSDYVAMDQLVRSVGASNYGNYSPWRKMQPEDMNRFKDTEFPVSLYGLASFHPSGYVREAAVKELARQNSGAAIPFLLLRMNDWVGSIRERAHQALRERLNPVYAKHWLKNWPLLLHLKCCGRGDTNIIEPVTELLRTDACKEALQFGMNHRNKLVRKASFQIIAESTASARREVFAQLIYDADPSMRAWAIRHLVKDVPDADLPALIKPMLNDRHMPVRSQALWLMAERWPEAAREALLAGLLDDHVAVREMARHFLSREASFDAREIYLEKLRSQKSVPAALCGLGETGGSDDGAVILPYLKRSEARVRRCAVYALGRLDVEKYLGVIFEKLFDLQSSVVRQAMKALQPKARLVPVDDLEALVSADERKVVHQAVIVLLSKKGKWERLPLILMLCAVENAVTANLALNALNDWFERYNRSFTEPTRSDHERINKALDKWGYCASAKAVKEVRSCLKIYFPNS